MKLQDLAACEWIEGRDDGRVLTSAVDGKPIASITSDGIDFANMLKIARQTGGPKLRKLPFHERALMCKELAKFQAEHKKEFCALSTETGAKPNDSWIDIDGGISTLYEGSFQYVRDVHRRFRSLS